MKKDILSWNDVKERYLEFHKMDSFTENMAIDIDFGYWLVNNCNIPDVSNNEVAVCDHPEEALIIDKTTPFCLACGKNIPEQTDC